jgi:hypothetical protein
MVSSDSKSKLKKTLEAQQAESKARKEQLSKLTKQEKAANEERQAAETIMQEGSAKLASAIKAKDFKQVSVAQMMFEQGQKRLRDASSQLEKVTRQKFSVISKSTVAEQTHSDSSSSTAKKRKCT